MYSSELCKQGVTLSAKLWDESDITLMRIRTNSAVCSWSCVTVRSHGVVISQTWSHCTVMWIRSQVSEVWKRMHVAQQSRNATWGYSSAQRPRVRLQWSLKDYKALRFCYGSSFVVLGLNALLNLFTTLFSFFIPWNTTEDVHSKASVFFWYFLCCTRIL